MFSVQRPQVTGPEDTPFFIQSKAIFENLFLLRISLHPIVWTTPLMLPIVKPVPVLLPPAQGGE